MQAYVQEYIERNNWKIYHRVFCHLSHYKWLKYVVDKWCTLGFCGGALEDFVIILFRFDLLFNSINSSLIPSISKQIGLKNPKEIKTYRNISPYEFSSEFEDIATISLCETLLQGICSSFTTQELNRVWLVLKV